MLANARAACVDHDPELSVADLLRRAAAELADARSGLEEAFDRVDAEAGPALRAAAPYVVAMQSIDTLGQQIGAIERLLLNLGGHVGADAAIPREAALAGLTLAAVAARLAAAGGGMAQQAGECDLF